MVVCKTYHSLEVEKTIYLFAEVLLKHNLVDLFLYLCPYQNSVHFVVVHLLHEQIFNKR